MIRGADQLLFECLSWLCNGSGGEKHECTGNCRTRTILMACRLGYKLKRSASPGFLCVPMVSQGVARLQQNRAGACTLNRRYDFLCNPQAGLGARLVLDDLHARRM
jgi:hypothetical protein